MNEQEPKPPKGVATAPESLSQSALAVWQAIAGVCLAMGTLTPADESAFATLCELEATRRAASKEKDVEGFSPFLLSQDFDGAPKVSIHPAIKLERDTANALRPYYEKFGMEPSGRSRIKVPKVEPTSKWEGLVG